MYTQKDKSTNPFVSKMVHDGAFLRTEGNQPFYDGIVADLRTWGTPLEGYQPKDRADYICKAVNNHDALLEACKEGLESLKFARTRLDSGVFEGSIAILRQAINQATK